MGSTLVVDYCRVEGHPHHLSVSCLSRADSSVGWVLRETSSIARLHFLNPFESLKRGFDAPEAAAAEGDPAEHDRVDGVLDGDLLVSHQNLRLLHLKYTKS